MNSIILYNIHCYLLHIQMDMIYFKFYIINLIKNKSHKLIRFLFVTLRLVTLVPLETLVFTLSRKLYAEVEKYIGYNMKYFGIVKMTTFLVHDIF